MSITRTALVAVFSTVAATAGATTLVDDKTPGLYNDGIGAVLNGTDPFFVNPGSDDPTVSLGSGAAPDLSPASAALGDWLTNPDAPSGTGWSTGPVAIPASWTVESETTIIYEIDGGAGGLGDVTADIGVDNGILVWLNGAFIGGKQAPGGASPGEHSFVLGDLAAGPNYLQLLREDHGGSTDFTISVTGDPVAPIPLPATGLLLVAGLGGIAAARTRV